MRLRRETGDFRIKIDSEGNVNTINKLLLGEDFVGQVAEVDGTFEVVTKATENKSAGTVTAVCESYTLTYTKATGAIEASPNTMESK